MWQADRSRIAAGVLAKRVATDAEHAPGRAWLVEVGAEPTGAFVSR